MGCWTLVVIVAVYTLLGILLAWIAQMVAREEVEIKTGIITLVVSGIVWILMVIGLATVIGEAVDYVGVPLNFAILTCALHVIAKLGWKHSAIIAAIYSAVLFLLGLALSSCAAAATSVQPA